MLVLLIHYPQGYAKEERKKKTYGKSNDNTNDHIREYKMKSKAEGGEGIVAYARR